MRLSSQVIVLLLPLAGLLAACQAAAAVGAEPAVVLVTLPAAAGPTPTATASLPPLPSATLWPPTATPVPIETLVAATSTALAAAAQQTAEAATQTAEAAQATEQAAATIVAESAAATATALAQPAATVPPLPTLPPTPTPLAPTPDAAATTRSLRVPILMYHYVEPWPAGADKVRQGLTVLPADFAAQMAYLTEQGYTTISLYDLVAAVQQGVPLPERPVVITFDDGYRSLMDYAVPTLAAHGYTGTIFVLTQLMDEGFEQFLTWPQAEALFAAGWQIEPHGKTHDQLAGRGRDFQLYQILGSAQTVAAHTGQTPRFLAYPSGQFDDLSIQVAREVGLWGAVSTQYGSWHSASTLFSLRRVRVSGRGDLAAFVDALEKP